MENTDKIIFEDDRSEWFLALGDRWVGPLSAADIFQRIQAQEVTWAHFVWRKGQKDWTRLCETQPFEAAVPAAPGQKLLKEIGQGAPKSAEKKGGAKLPPGIPGPDARDWFLYYNDAQFGPFSFSEVENYLRVGKITGRVHAWKNGMANWTRLEEVKEFQTAVKVSIEAWKTRTQAAGKSSPPAPAKDERRIAPRHPLVAHILMTDEETVIVGVCRDISIGGMQVLTDHIPGPVGTRLKLNVSPSSSETKAHVKPFVAEGEVVRVLEDGRGFSFRFSKLPEGSQKAIEEYLRNAS